MAEFFGDIEPTPEAHNLDVVYEALASLSRGQAWCTNWVPLNALVECCGALSVDKTTVVETLQEWMQLEVMHFDIGGARVRFANGQDFDDLPAAAPTSYSRQLSCKDSGAVVDLRVDCELVSEAIPAPKMVPAICDVLPVPSYCKKYFHIQEEWGLWHHTTQNGKKRT